MRWRHAFYSTLPPVWQSHRLLNSVALHIQLIQEDCFVSVLFKYFWTRSWQPHTNTHIYFPVNHMRPNDILPSVFSIFALALRLLIQWRSFFSFGFLFSVVCKVLLCLCVRTTVAHKHIHAHISAINSKGPWNETNSVVKQVWLCFWNLFITLKSLFRSCLFIYFFKQIVFSI